jgi:ATP-binding cassette subfamily B (MDR/TAP) protein 11
VYTLRIKLFSKLLKLPVAFFDKQDNTAGGISAKISQDSYQIHNMITGVMGVIFLNVSTVSTSLILAFYYSWKLTLIVLALAPLLIVSGAINMSILKGMS